MSRLNVCFNCVKSGHWAQDCPLEQVDTNSYGKVVTSALVIIPPTELWSSIQSIRSKNDKAYERWMPHINLLYPFVEEDYIEEASERLNLLVTHLSPFTLSLKTVSHFSFGPNSTMFLEASTQQVNNLQECLYKIFPHCTELNKKSGNEGFHGHLTLGQFPTRSISTVEKNYQESWQALEFEVNTIHLITRPTDGNGHFTIQKSFNLGSAQLRTRYSYVAPPYGYSRQNERPAQRMPRDDIRRTPEEDERMNMRARRFGIPEREERAPIRESRDIPRRYVEPPTRDRYTPPQMRGETRDVFAAPPMRRETRDVFAAPPMRGGMRGGMAPRGIPQQGMIPPQLATRGRGGVVPGMRGRGRGAPMPARVPREPREQPTEQQEAKTEVVTSVTVQAPTEIKVSNAKKNKQKKKNAKRKIQRAEKQLAVREELKIQREQERQEKLIEKIKIPFEALEKKKEKPAKPSRRGPPRATTPAVKPLYIFTVFLEDERIVPSDQIINNSGTVTPLIRNLVYGTQEYLDAVFTAARGQRPGSADYIIYVVQKKKMPEPAPKPPVPAPTPVDTKPQRRKPKKEEEEDADTLTESKIGSKKIQLHCSACATELKKPKTIENNQRVFLSVYLPPDTPSNSTTVIPGVVPLPENPEQKVIQIIKTQLEGKDRKATIFVLRNHESTSRSTVASGVEYVSTSHRGLSLVEYLIKQNLISETKINQFPKMKSTKKKEVDVAQLESKLEEELKTEYTRELRLARREIDKKEDARKINKILSRIGAWIIDRLTKEEQEQQSDTLGQRRSTLPQSTEKLKSAIARFCNIKEKLSPSFSQAIVDLLLKELCLGQCHLCSNYYYNTDRIRASVTVSKRDKSGLATDVDDILLRVKEMLLGILTHTKDTNALPKDPHGLLNRIENLGHKKEFDTELIYNQLIANNFVSLEHKSAHDTEQEIQSFVEKQKRKDPHFRYVGQAVNAEQYDLVYNVAQIQQFINKVQNEYCVNAGDNLDNWAVPQEEEEESDEEEEIVKNTKNLKAKKLTLADELKLIESMAECHLLPPNMQVRNFDDVLTSDEWEPVLRGIYAYGFEHPSDIQSKAIPLCVRTNRDCLMIAPSGTGKTAAYAIPIISKIDTSVVSCQAIVVVPTREIALQVTHVIKAIGEYKNVTVHTSIGGTPMRQDITAFATHQVIVGTCGRILDLQRRGASLAAIKMLVIEDLDEFMANMSSKDQLYNLVTALPSSGMQILCVGTTLNLVTAEVTDRVLLNPVWLLPPFKNYSFQNVLPPKVKFFKINLEREEHKLDLFSEIYSTLHISQCFVYCNSKRKIEWLTQKVRDQGLTVSSVHGDIQQSERDLILKEFRTGSSRVMITCGSHARGIDVNGVDLVINYDLPADIAEFVHRAGRAGRYNRIGAVISFVTVEDNARAKQIERDCGLVMKDLDIEDLRSKTVEAVVQQY